MNVLRARGVGALIAGVVVSSLGTQMTFLALPWFVLETTGSATRMGIALAVELVPVAILGIPVALAASSFFSPLVNAPLIGVITMRTPEALRAKVMTAVLTTALIAGPVGLLIAGPLLESWGPRQVFLLVASGQLLATIPFALVAFRSNTPLAAELA